MSYFQPHVAAPLLGVTLGVMRFFDGDTNDSCSPDFAQLARSAEQAGARQITLAFTAPPSAVESDMVRRVKAAIGIDLQLAIPFDREAIQLTAELAPHRVRLHGIDRSIWARVPQDDEAAVIQAQVGEAISALRARGIGAVLPVDLDAAQIALALAAGAERVEINPGRDPAFVLAATNGPLRAFLSDAADQGLFVVLAGDGQQANFADLMALPGIGQIELGRHLITQAISAGWASAVGDCLNGIAGRASCDELIADRSFGRASEPTGDRAA